jgi:FSR family fosmidomycin resistance protein-like MFS transporter
MDRRGITMLAAGHLVIDASTGAVPAMLPIFTAVYALSDLAASMILGASLLVSSAIQPLFGLLADRRATPVFLWGGVAVAAAGLALAGTVAGYLGILACVVGSGLGIAAFHPEAARVANRISAERPTTGLAWFMLGGNIGFALGPLLVALAIPFLDEQATLVILVPGALVSLWLFHDRQRLAVAVSVPSHDTPLPPRASLWAIGLLMVVTSMRTWTQFGLLALAPLLLVDDRGFSDQQAGFAVVAFSGAGAAGTIAGASIANRVGGRHMLMWTMPVAAPLIAAFLLSDGWVSIAAFSLAGLVLMASFAVTVSMGQEYLPGRLALAAGLLIGFGAIGSAPIGLAIFGAIADSAGREAAIWGLALLPLIGALLAAVLPDARRLRAQMMAA